MFLWVATVLILLTLNRIVNKEDDDADDDEEEEQEEDADDDAEMMDSYHCHTSVAATDLYTDQRLTPNDPTGIPIRVSRFGDSNSGIPIKTPFGYWLIDLFHIAAGLEQKTISFVFLQFEYPHSGIPIRVSPFGYPHSGIPIRVPPDQNSSSHRRRIRPSCLIRSFVSMTPPPPQTLSIHPSTHPSIYYTCRYAYKSHWFVCPSDYLTTCMPACRSAQVDGWPSSVTDIELSGTPIHGWWPSWND